MRPPPGAPRKQQAHQAASHRPDSGTIEIEGRSYAQAGPSRTRSDVYRSARNVSASSSSRTASSGSSHLSLAPDLDAVNSAAAAATAAALFGDHATTRTLRSDASAASSTTPRQPASLLSIPPGPSRRDASWLSRSLHPMVRGGADQSTHGLFDTPTMLAEARPAQTLAARERGVPRESMGADIYATPTNPSHRGGGSETSLLTQITRRFAAARRPAAQRQQMSGSHSLRQSSDGRQANHMSADEASRPSLAASSGWGSPRGAAGAGGDHALPELGPISADGARVPSSARPQSASAVHTDGPVQRSDEGVRAWASQAQAPPFSRLTGAAADAAATNHDGSYNVVRDEGDANNSGLLPLTPGVRRLPGLGMTALRGRQSKTSSDLSYINGAAEISKAARSSEPSDRSMGMPPSIVEYDLEGVDIASVDAMEARRADLLRRTGFAEEGPSEETAALVEIMRGWREDAMKHHLYDTAIFWGSKILSMETSQLAWNDAYNLATAYFLTHRYAQAEHLLCNPLKLNSRRGVKAVGTRNAEDHDRQAEGDELGAALQAVHSASKLPSSLLCKAEGLLGARDGGDNGVETAEIDRGPRLSGKRKRREFTVSGAGSASEAGSVGVNGDLDIDSPGPTTTGVKYQKDREEPPSPLSETYLEPQWARPMPDAISLVDVSVPCKYLAAQCMVRQAKYQEALDELDLWQGGMDDEAFSKSCQQSSKDGLIKLSSSIWHLKGMIHLRLRHIEPARDCFIKSLSIDVKNFESFDQLVRGHLLSASEQWEFVENLQYIAQAGSDPILGEALHLVRLMYTSMLDKSCKEYMQRTTSARHDLANMYGLGDNPDVLLGLAEEHYMRMQYRDAYNITRHIMELSRDHEAALPIHISSMQTIENLRPSLYLLAHHLTDADPDLPAAWYAVGCWYYSTQQWLEARKYFSKSVQINPRFAPGWVAFAHTFAYEGESDQAIVSYSTAERNFSSHYLIKLFLGMEHLHQDNLTLAELNLGGSAEVWEEDPLSRNERGVVAYYNGKLDEAITLFHGALEAAKRVQQPASAWTSTHLNLGHAYRRSGELEKAYTAYLRAGELDPDCDAAFVGAGMCCHGQSRLDEALTWYNRALAVNPADKYARDLTLLVLRESAQMAPSVFASHEESVRSGRSWQAAASVDGNRKNKMESSAIRNGDITDHPALQRIAEQSINIKGEGNDTSGSQVMSLAEGSASIDMDETDA